MRADLAQLSGGALQQHGRDFEAACSERPELQPYGSWLAKQDDAASKAIGRYQNGILKGALYKQGKSVWQQSAAEGGAAAAMPLAKLVGLIAYSPQAPQAAEAHHGAGAAPSPDPEWPLDVAPATGAGAAAAPAAAPPRRSTNPDAVIAHLRCELDSTREQLAAADARVDAHRADASHRVQQVHTAGVPLFSPARAATPARQAVAALHTPPTFPSPGCSKRLRPALAQDPDSGGSESESDAENEPPCLGAEQPAAPPLSAAQLSLRELRRRAVEHGWAVPARGNKAPGKWAKQTVEQLAPSIAAALGRRQDTASHDSLLNDLKCNLDALEKARHQAKPRSAEQQQIEEAVQPCLLCACAPPSSPWVLVARRRAGDVIAAHVVGCLQQAAESRVAKARAAEQAALAEVERLKAELAAAVERELEAAAGEALAVQLAHEELEVCTETVSSSSASTQALARQTVSFCNSLSLEAHLMR